MGQLKNESATADIRFGQEREDPDDLTTWTNEGANLTDQLDSS